MVRSFGSIVATLAAVLALALTATGPAAAATPRVCEGPGTAGVLWTHLVSTGRWYGRTSNYNCQRALLQKGGRVIRIIARSGRRSVFVIRMQRGFNPYN